MIYKVTLAYDGWNYAGWQKQTNALGIQEIIEKALFKIHRKEVPITASGRTDAHVHALGQVFHFEPLPNMSCEQYRTALNALLPEDIRIQKVEKAGDDFHARFSAKSKRYDYICTYEKDNPFTYKYKMLLNYPVDVDLMREGAAYLVGTHDFTSYSSSRIHPDKSRIKTITRIDIETEGQDIRFIFEGNGFLRYQVRMMTAVLLEVGKKRMTPYHVKEILDSRDKEASRYNAKPQGLYLVKVDYDTTDELSHAYKTL